ncbi:cell division protein FtsI [Nakamurella sp. YIM 132087]|uniref:Cell division protein FtsI n=1 Tax=Nakamurella alba TaxID=2665158 RepID=A0A7K1FQV1_9ACTN|nr:penicillin-binding protein 2 [Nakamurella alba]MTD16516.1 cell division protein FtsI [Nakamurella alba]
MTTVREPSGRSGEPGRTRRVPPPARSARTSGDARAAGGRTTSVRGNGLPAADGRGGRTTGDSSRSRTRGTGRGETRDRSARASDSAAARGTTRNGRTDRRPVAPSRPARERRAPDRPAPARGRTPGTESTTDRTVRAARRPVRSHRGHRTRRDRAVRYNVTLRHRGALVILLVLLLAAAVKLVIIQGVQADELTAQSRVNMTKTAPIPATRGAITDRNGSQLAFTIEGRQLAARPGAFLDDPTNVRTVENYDGDDVPARTAAQKRELVADIIIGVLGEDRARGTDRATLLAQMSRTDTPYVYLVKQVLPAQADNILEQVKAVLGYEEVVLNKGTAKETVMHEIDAISAESKDIRQNPDGTLAEAVVGVTGNMNEGLSGVESKYNALLAGTNGSITQQYTGGRPVPDTVTKDVPVVNGTGITLTLDSDLQYSVEQMVADKVNATGAKRGCAIVKGVKDGQIYSMYCYEPGKTALETGNPALLEPFEPGSVNKVVTFAAALDAGLITPDTVIKQVDDSIEMGGRSIRDAWSHDPVDMTATGVLAKSSNVGTLMIAQKVGEDAFESYLKKFGLGQKTGIGLAESAGQLPERDQWSATSFANLPIGQGVSMTMVQLVDMYQAIGNKGVMIQPSIVAGTTTDGVWTAAKAPTKTRVMKETSATALLEMLQATTQSGRNDGDIGRHGTAPDAAVTGYPVAGKTGTAQQIDPATGTYSDTVHTLTFAGVAPANDPVYAVAVMLDAPNEEGEAGEVAAPLFHDIMAYALRAADVPPTATVTPEKDLYVGDGWQ